MIFVVPDIAGTPTGGNIYNRRVLDHWPTGTPTVVTWPVDAPPSDPVRGITQGGSPDATVLIDSLCMKHADAIRTLRERRPRARIAVLAHYLACVDPRKQDSDTAQAERDLLPLLDGAITTSAFVKDRLIREDLPESSITVAAPGLDRQFRRDDADTGSGLRKNERAIPQLLTVANVLPGKGLDVLLRALEQLPDQAWRWRLIGGTDLDPDYGARFRDMLNRTSFRDCVAWNGTVEAADMPAAYDAADVFVLPTHFETCSMATREAMARGCAVVASDVGGLPDNFGGPHSGGQTAGVLVPPNDPDALAETLRNLLTDPDRRASLARKALAQSQSFPSWETTAARCADALRRLRVPSLSPTERTPRSSGEETGASREP